MKLVNIRNDDITDGNPKLTLGLIWTIILHFQVRTRLLSSVCGRTVHCGRVLHLGFSFWGRRIHPAFHDGVGQLIGLVAN